MKAPWHESRGLIPWMFLFTVLLTVALAIKEGWFAFIDFRAHKDKIDGITKLLNSTILMIGGIFSYFRFFKGRTLRQKLNIYPSVGLICLEDHNLHWIDIQLENRGSVSIWNHEITIYATLHASEPYCVRLTEFMSLVGGLKKQEHLIDVGESAYEHASIRLPKNIHAITYQIVVKDDRGTMWDRCITCANTQPQASNKTQ